MATVAHISFGFGIRLVAIGIGNPYRISLVFPYVRNPDTLYSTKRGAWCRESANRLYNLELLCHEVYELAMLKIKIPHMLPNLVEWLLVVALVASLPGYALAQGKDPLADLHFRNIGPAIAGGRVTAVQGVPSRPQLIYAGTAGGGVWKSINGGASWKPIFTHEATASIGAISVAPSAPESIWVGTGESNLRSDVRDGDGVYFSSDGGAHWRFMGLKHAGQIAKILIDPNDHNVVYVAVLGNAWKPNRQRGVFRTTDGGKTWKKVLYANPRTGAIDIAMAPNNPKILFAALWQVQRRPWTFVDGGPGSGLYESTDGGDSWHRLDHSHNGLPSGPLGRIGIAFAPSDPSRLYALIEAKMGLLWTSSNEGASWHEVSDNHALDVRPFYFSQVAVAPNNPDKVYFGAVHLMVSNNGGKSAHIADKSVHPDHHAIWIDPRNPSYILQGTDGGVFVTRDGGKTWDYLDNLPIEQFYSIALDNRIPFDICGGLQDNGVWCGPSSNLNRPGVDGTDWHMIKGGDGQYAVPAPSNPNIIYSDSQRGFISRYNSSTGLSRFVRPYVPGYGRGWAPAKFKYRFNWTTPIAVSPDNSNTIYEGANVVFKSTDGGSDWHVISPDLTRDDKSKQQLPGGPINLDLSGAETYDTILALSLAPSAPNHVIWVGTDDGHVQVTQTGGKHWSNVTPADSPAWAQVDKIGVSPFDPGTAFVPFNARMLGNDHPYVYVTRNYGKTWTKITHGLPPEAPVNVVREDPHKKGLLVLGTDTGLYYSNNYGDDWKPLTGNFPTAPVVDIKFSSVGHALVVATHGRGVFVLDNLLPLEGLNSNVLHSAFHLFPAAPGYLFHHNDYAEKDSVPPRYVAPNAPEGVTFSYFIGAQASASSGGTAHHITIRIFDRSHILIDTLVSTPHPGVNELTWNMRYRGPHRLDFIAYNWVNSLNGPYVLPGDYYAVVQYRGQQKKEDITIHPDPRFRTPSKALAALEKTGLLLRKEIDTVNANLNGLHALQLQTRRTIATLTKHVANPTAIKQLKVFSQSLDMLERTVFNPSIQHDVPEDDIHYLASPRDKLIELYRMIANKRPVVPIDQITEEVRHVCTKINIFVRKYLDIKTNQLPKINSMLKKLHISAIVDTGKTE